MTNVIDFTAYRASKAPRAATGEAYENNVVSMSDWKDAQSARRLPHVTTDVLATGGSAC